MTCSPAAILLIKLNNLFSGFDYVKLTNHACSSTIDVASNVTDIALSDAKQLCDDNENCGFIWALESDGPSSFKFCPRDTVVTSTLRIKSSVYRKSNFAHFLVNLFSMV